MEIKFWSDKTDHNYVESMRLGGNKLQLVLRYFIYFSMNQLKTAPNILHDIKEKGVKAEFCECISSMIAKPTIRRKLNTLDAYHYRIISTSKLKKKSIFENSELQHISIYSHT